MTQKGLFFNTSLFIYEIFTAISHGIVITLITIYVYRLYIIDIEGHTSDFWSVSVVVYSVLIIITNLLTLIRSSHITWLLIFAIFVTSLIPFILFMIIYDRWSFINTQSIFSVRFILRQWHYYIVVLLNIFIISFYEIVKLFMKYQLNPTMTEYFQQLTTKKLVDDEHFWTEDLIKEVKKKSSEVRVEKKRKQ